MAERRALVATIWAKGFRVGIAPDLACRQCSHIWGEHHLYIDIQGISPSGDVPTLAGRWSCPNDCECVGTWSINWPAKDGEACGWGRTITRDGDEPCSQPPTCVLALNDTGQNVHLCQEHFDQITAELDRLHPQD